MAKTQVSIPQGTRDFDSAVLRKRDFIFNTIRSTFELYGFQPLETPAFENIETLTGKYGEEGDKLIFRILNNGLADPKNIGRTRSAFDKLISGTVEKDIAERALRYDLTIPFARYVAMHHQQLTLPYKRYQIQPVWRADRPQRGRYREFYQCDADIVGSYSLLNEVELSAIYSAVFNKLNVNISLKINNRKILVALAEACGSQDLLSSITVAIDKLDKIGEEKVLAELSSRGLDDQQISLIQSYLQISGSNHEKIQQLRDLFGHIEHAKAGLAEIVFVLDYTASQHTIPELDFTLARGLNYYTGLIFEVMAKDVQMGSIGGGGRYDNLTGSFGVNGIPGVGISFGVDRIYDVMEELSLFPAALESGTKVIFFNLGGAESARAFNLAQQLRQKNVTTELYPDQVRIDKQFRYAEKKNIPFAVIIGSNELQSSTCTFKNLMTGEQSVMTEASLFDFDFGQVGYF